MKFYGIQQGTSIEIPFSDIKAINLVEYHSAEYATIYLVTKEDYQVHKLNFDNNSPQLHFRKKKGGQKVYQLMIEQGKLSQSQSFN